MSELLSAEQLSEIEARANNATPDWKCVVGFDGAIRRKFLVRGDCDGLKFGHHYDPEIRNQQDIDCEFSAHARQDVPALLAHIKAIEVAHDKRVTQLLEANNREVERRREAENSRDDWKRDAIGLVTLLRAHLSDQAWEVVKASDPGKAFDDLKDKAEGEAVRKCAELCEQHRLTENVLSGLRRTYPQYFTEGR